MIVFLDMDGVIANWTKQVAKVLNINYDKMISSWTPGLYDTASQLGISDGWMWQNIDAYEQFWEEIEIYDYAQKLVKYLKKNHELHICSSPSRHKNSMAGKSVWLSKHKLGFGRNFIFTPQKHLLAAPGRVLIDDLDKNIDKFNEHKGHGFLWSQPWNSDYANIDTRTERLYEFLDNLSS
jgi:5'(3')-deoxyribonucleotidase